VPLSDVTRVFLRLLAFLFTRLTADRKRQRSQPPLRNLASAFGAGTVGSDVETKKRLVDADQHVPP